MNSIDYMGEDPEGLVREKMLALGVRPVDRVDVFGLLKPLGMKGEAGAFHRQHCLRVGLVAARIAGRLGMDERALLIAGLLHDVGKALVPCCVLGATKGWTAEDQREMEAHVDYGFALLRDRFDFSAHVIVQHHRFQARSYPLELPPSNQPFSEETLRKAEASARVLAVADVYDALHRVNSATDGRALSEDEIRDKLIAGAGGVYGSSVESLYDRGVLPWEKLHGA